MNELIKKCLKKINGERAVKGETLGHIVSDILFPKDKFALVVDNQDKLYYILTSSKNSQDGRLEMVSLLAELLSVLDSLVEQNLVLVVKGTMHTLSLYGEGLTQPEKTQIEGTYKCGDVYVLKYNEGRYILSDGNGKEILSSIDSDNAAYDRLSVLLQSVIIPTSQFEDYVKRGFVTAEQKIAKESLILAYAVAILTPIVTLLLGNWYGVTKLDNDQFQSLNSPTVVHDTIIVTKRDTIICDSSFCKCGIKDSSKTQKPIKDGK